MDNNKQFAVPLIVVALLITAGLVAYNAFSVPPLSLAISNTIKAVDNTAAVTEDTDTDYYEPDDISQTSSADSTQPNQETESGAENNAQANEAVGEQEKTTKQAAKQISYPININTATAEEMAQALNGIGEVISQRIVEYRQQSGGFKSIDQIKEVKGIGDAKFEKIKDKITVG